MIQLEVAIAMTTNSKNMEKNINQNKIKPSEKIVSRTTSNWMKKNKILAFFVFIFICFPLYANVASAADPVSWWYKNPLDNSKYATKGPFTTPETCNTDRDALVQSLNIKVPVSCYQETLANVEAMKASDAADKAAALNPQKSTSSDVYTLLAPIGELKTAPSNFGDYVNTIFKIAIGLCGALAVIMIIIGGIQYMGNESIFGKTEAKGQITNAILGLLIAIGSYALLNTINPDLLKTNIAIKQVIASIEEENITTVGTGAVINGETIKITPGYATACTGGITSIPSNMGSGQICRDLLNKLTTLKAATDAIGVTWKITSTIRDGGALGSCHFSGGTTSGNCADIVIIGGDYSNLCVAIAKVGGLNFANEATSTGYCQNIKPYKTYSTTTGPHLHVNFIG